jgi:ATP-dependent exoDNAse (exonuclease V) alpha subunit
MPDTLIKNDDFRRAFDVFENSRSSMFLTGRAGTGKSTLLQLFRTSTHKNTVVLAPTGVAAVNIKGQTIHSFFNFRPDVAPENAGNIRLRRAQRDVYKALDAIIIDEISMVRADLLDCIDVFLRAYARRPDEPFGGVQMILVGDLYQLPPVVTRQEEEAFRGLYPSPYFFDARVFSQVSWEFVELETVYRQTEDAFIGLLNAVRHNTVSDADLKLLNTRCRLDFVPPAEDFYVYLTTTNSMADDVNRSRLDALGGRVYEYAGEQDGSFEDRNLPTQKALQLKFGAQVMLLNNDSMGRWVNGSIGHVIDIIHGEEDAVRVRLSDGHEVDVAPFKWEMYRFVYDKEAERLTSEVVGSFRQYPLRLAWAVTIHKAQGKTFPKLVIDVGRGTFSHGQVYVALSRATSLEGLVLKRPINRQHILMDRRVVGFMENLKKRMRKTHIVLE